MVLPHFNCLMKKKFYNYDGCPVFLETAEYRNNNSLAVIMFSAEGELYGDVTVNLNHPMQSKRMAFLDENNMPGIGKWIEKNKHESFTSVKARSVSCVYSFLKHKTYSKRIQQVPFIGNNLLLRF